MLFLKTWLFSFLVSQKQTLRQGRKVFQQFNKPLVQPRVSTSKNAEQNYLKEKTRILCCLSSQGDIYESTGKKIVQKTLETQFQFFCYCCTNFVGRFLWLNTKQTIQAMQISSKERFIYLTKLTRCIFISKTVTSQKIQIPFYTV